MSQKFTTGANYKNRYEARKAAHRVFLETYQNNGNLWVKERCTGEFEGVECWDFILYTTENEELDMFCCCIDSQ